MDGLPAAPIDDSVTSVLTPPTVSIPPPPIPAIPKAEPVKINPQIVEIAKPKVQPRVANPTLPPPPQKKHRLLLTGCLGILLFIVLGVVTVFVLALTSPTGELILDSADLVPMLVQHASPSATPSAKISTPSATKAATPSAFEGLLD